MVWSKKHRLVNSRLEMNSRMGIVEIFRKDGLIAPEALWDEVLYTGQAQVAAVTGKAGSGRVSHRV